MHPVLSSLRRAADRDLMPRNSAILLAVSGGADSMALLRGSVEIAPEAGWELSVAHVHHGLRRREADRDLSFVREHARRLSLPFLCRRIDASAVARAHGLSPEAGARQGRYEALREMAREAGAARIAVAHQKDDLVETHRLALSRRGGVFALAGPRELRADGVVRPLLDVARREILEFLAARSVAFRRDGSNGDLRFARNRARRELARSGPREREALARSASRYRADRDRLERDLEERLRPRRHLGPGVALFDAEFLGSCPRDLARAGLAAAAAPFAAPGRAPFTGREREKILDLLAGGDDFRFEAGRRIRFERRGRLLRVAPAPGVSGELPKV